MSAHHRTRCAVGRGMLVLGCFTASCGDAKLPPSSDLGGSNAAGGAITSMAGAASVAGASTTTAGAPTGGVASSSAGGAGSSGAGGQSGAPVSGGVGGSSGAAANGGAGEANANGGASSSRIIVPDPSWTCGKAEGIVDPKLGQLVFSASVSVGQVREVGATQFGKRRASDLTGATIAGNKLEAALLGGGLDLELELSNGARELEQVAMLRAKDGSLIYLRSCGVAPAGESVVRIVPDFEVATSSPLAWLNTGNFVGTRSLDVTGKKLELAVYDVSAVKAEGQRVQLEDPAGVAHQPWECIKATGSKSTEVFTESVTLGGSLSVGASKRGTRNVIPITGGTVTGKLMGTVVNAGADYQLIGGSTLLDARYLLASNDGEVVVVRNCGAIGALVPQFETRSAGPYAFLNSGKFISSDPSSAAGGVKITFYELQ